MKTLTCLLFLLVCRAGCYCQKSVAGVYKSNFAIKGDFVESLSLACDSTFEYNRFSTSHPYIKGKWGILDTHVFLIADTGNGKNFGYFWQTFFYKDGKLLAFSPEDYKIYVKNMVSVKDTSVKVIDIPEPNMAYYKKTGKLKLYYLAKTNTANCIVNNN